MNPCPELGRPAPSACSQCPLHPALWMVDLEGSPRRAHSPAPCMASKHTLSLLHLQDLLSCVLSDLSQRGQVIVMSHATLHVISGYSCKACVPLTPHQVVWRIQGKQHARVRHAAGTLLRPIPCPSSPFPGIPGLRKQRGGVWGLVQPGSPGQGHGPPGGFPTPHFTTS